MALSPSHRSIAVGREDISLALVLAATDLDSGNSGGRQSGVPFILFVPIVIEFLRFELGSLAMLVLSKGKVVSLADMSPGSIKMAVRRGRLEQVDILVDGTVCRGITFKSLREYYGWSQALCDRILDADGLTEDAPAFWQHNPCLICGREGAEYFSPAGKRIVEGRDDVDCSKCGGYSIADEYKPLLKALDSRSLKMLSLGVSARYHSGSIPCVVEIDPASLKEMLK